MYRSEAMFSSALVKAFKSKCSFIQRIESKTTGRGIPDLYLRFRNEELWLELKNDRYNTIYMDQFVVDWRKGQQAWHLDYYRACGRPVITIVAMKDGFVVIPVYRRYVRGVVPYADTLRYITLGELVERTAENV